MVQLIANPLDAGEFELRGVGLHGGESSRFDLEAEPSREAGGLEATDDGDSDFARLTES